MVNSGRILLVVALLTGGSQAALADSVTMELEYRTDNLHWQLFASVVDTTTGNTGNHGLAAVRALIDNIDFGTNGDAVNLAAGIGAIDPIAVGTPNERPAVVLTAGGTLDVIYAQDLAIPASVVGGVGVGSRALIADGTFASAVLPPAFGNDDSGFVTDGNFLNVAAPGPFGLALPWNGFMTLTVTDVTPSGAVAGDYNGDSKVDAADYTLWRDHLGGDAAALATGSRDPGNVGPIDTDDYNFWKTNFGSGGAAAVASAVPEPSAFGLLIIATCILAMFPFHSRSSKLVGKDGCIGHITRSHYFQPF